MSKPKPPPIPAMRIERIPQAPAKPDRAAAGRAVLIAAGRGDLVGVKPAEAKPVAPAKPGLRPIAVIGDHVIYTKLPPWRRL